MTRPSKYSLSAHAPVDDAPAGAIPIESYGRRYRRRLATPEHEFADDDIAAFLSFAARLKEEANGDK